MSGKHEPSFDAGAFSGRARLFPLPNLVLFPHILQPLHIFEQRFRDLFDDAIETDELIAMAHLLPGWEADYEGDPPVFPIACLGRITSYKRLPDGRCNLLLRGVRRIRLCEEFDNGKTFREADAELLEDYYSDGGAERRVRLEEELVSAFAASCPDLEEVQQHLDELRSEGICLGMLTDILGYALDLDLAVKDELLGELDVVRRAEILLAQLKSPLFGAQAARARSPLKYPPDFSAN